MNTLGWMQRLVAAGLAIATGLGAGATFAYTAPYATPPGVTLVDITANMGQAAPLFMWRRLGDADGNPLYTYDADRAGRSSCYDECAKEFPPFLANGHAVALGDWSLVTRDDDKRGRQWVYQGRPLYHYSGKNPDGEPKANSAITGNSADPSWHDPTSSVYSPKRGWRRAAYTPEKTTLMPPTVELDGLAIANGFGLVDAAAHMAIYAVPVSHKLSSDWRPVRASELVVPVEEFTIITRKDDGLRQWAYRGEALYTYAGDYAPGEVTGIFTGDKSIQAALVYRNFMPAGLAINHYIGREPLLTTTKGQTLYYVSRFFPLYGGRETRAGYGITYNDAKSQGTEACQADCTQTWKPLLATANEQASGFWEIVARPDGSRQWVFKGTPVYTFSGDKMPGDITGNNRHVILYGGPHGQIVYADAGGDPSDVQPIIGKNIDIRFAAGAPPIVDFPNATGAGNGGAAGAGTTAAGTGKGAGAAVAGDATRYRGAGAGLYWHTLGLYY